MPAGKKPKKKGSGTYKKAQTNKNYKTAYEKHKRNVRQVSAVIMFSVGILLLSLALIEGTNVWTICHNGIYGLFGITAIIMPIVLIYIAVIVALDKPIGEVKNKVWQTAVLAILVCGMFEVCSATPYIGKDFIEVVKGLYERGVTRTGGGFFSSVIGWPLYTGCGKTGAIIILALAMFTFVMLITGTTLISLFKGVSKPVKTIQESYTKHKENKDNTSNPRFDIDVDLGPDTAPMPEHPISSKKPSPNELLELEKQEVQSKIKILKGKKEKISVEPPKQQQETPKQIDDLVKKAMDTSAGVAAAAATTTPLPQTQSTPSPDVTFNEKDQAKLYTDENNNLNRYVIPPVSLLKPPKFNSNKDVSGELKDNAELLVNTLKSFGVQTKILDISRGPAVTRYELQPSAGVKVSKITGLADDIALNLAASGVRIEAPIPNKAAVGIEVPNSNIDVVTMRELVEANEFQNAKSKLSVGLGRDIAGNAVVADISKMPHVLIAGQTGSGKSVCINSIIISLLYKSAPSEVRFLMIDPKVVELGVYNGIPHLLVPVVTDPRKAAGALAWAVTEMINRYKLFAENNVRDMKAYNELAQNREELDPMPQIVIIIDELADLMMAAPGEVEDSICRLAQMARAAGMHLIIATQRPSVDVITGIIKANIPSRIAFSVASQVDSRTILDSGGAEKLLGRGDMLFFPSGVPKPLRVQGCFVSDKEVESVVDFIKNKESATYDDKIIEEIEKQAVPEKSSSNNAQDSDDSDELLNDAIECVIDAGQASTSYLQRKLKVGYARAARIIDEMEAKGIIGPYEGSKPRQVIMTRQQWIEMNMNNGD